MATTEDGSYRDSSFRSLLIAVFVLVALVLALPQLSDIVKLLGAPFLYLPAQFGLVQQVSHAEVHVVDPFEVSPRLLILSQPGRYTVYTDDVKLLARTNELADHQEAPWLAVNSAEESTSIAVAFVERGLRPYDTPLAKGRPIFTFVVDTPGRYNLALPARDGIITVLPDYTTGKEPIIVLLMLLQLGAVGTVAGIVVYIRTEPMRLRWKQQAAIDAQRQEQGEAFWQSEIQRSKDSGQRPE